MALKKKNNIQLSENIQQLSIGMRTLTLSHLDKVLFPKPKITKLHLIEYYYQIAPYMLPYIKNRPLSLVRYPDGITKDGFFQKNIGDYYPDWIQRTIIKKHDEGITVAPLCNDTATLVYLANQACITPHTWLSKIDKLELPDKIIFDLDPSDQKGFILVKKTALDLKKIIENLGLIPFVMTTGSRGLHVVIPIRRKLNFDAIRKFAHTIASLLVAQDPENRTTELSKIKRHGRLFIDCGRNAYAQTSVAPYAIRPKAGAPVATPLFWHELSDPTLTAQSFNYLTALQRAKTKQNPWKNISKSAQSVVQAEKKLTRLLND